MLTECTYDSHCRGGEICSDGKCVEGNKYIHHLKPAVQPYYLKRNYICINIFGFEIIIIQDVIKQQIALPNVPFVTLEFAKVGTQLALGMDKTLCLYQLIWVQTIFF